MIRIASFAVIVLIASHAVAAPPSGSYTARSAYGPVTNFDVDMGTGTLVWHSVPPLTFHWDPALGDGGRWAYCGPPETHLDFEPDFFPPGGDYSMTNPGSGPIDHGRYR